MLLCCKVISKDLFKILTTKIGRSGDQTFCDAAATDMPRNARNNENGKSGENSHSFGENYLKEISKGALKKFLPDLSFLPLRAFLDMSGESLSWCKNRISFQKSSLSWSTDS